MNIFYLDPDPVLCAQYHNDKHSIKMVVEYAQLLSTAHRVIDGTETVRLSKTGRKQKWFGLDDNRDSLLYNATHMNHPSAKWCRDSAANYKWLYNLFCALCDEYTYRYGKVHLTDMKLRHVLSHVPKNISNKVFMQPWRAMPDDMKIDKDSLASYRNYYINGKSHLSTWKGKINSRSIPEWYNANLCVS
jgi:hypothetical protein